MSYEKEKGWETNFPDNLIRLRIQANTSYQIKRIIRLVGEENALVEVDRSKIMVNYGGGPKLRIFVTFKDNKSDKLKKQREKKYKYRYYEENKRY